jgi:hypothetical protein
MNQYVAGLNWTDEQWARVVKSVKQEAERTRVAAKALPIYGPVSEDTLSVPNLSIDPPAAAPLIPPAAPGLVTTRIEVNSATGTVLATISMLVYVRTHEAADPELGAVLTMFRRAGNYIARIEDALMFNGQSAAGALPPLVGPAIPFAQVTNGRSQWGLIGGPAPLVLAPPHPAAAVVRGPIAAAAPGVSVVTAVVNSITALENNGYGPPYACIFGNNLYRDVHTPTVNYTLPREPIMALLAGGPLLRSSVIAPDYGAVISYESGQIEQVLASDVCVKFLYVSEEPRYVLRVSERVALRVRDWGAVVNIVP